MELWMIITKLIVLFFIMLRYVLLQMTDLPWVVFAVLLYFSLNLALYIVKRPRWKIAISLVSVALVLVFYQHIHPLFILLLPINICELASAWFSRSEIVFLSALLPVVFLPTDEMALYAVMAALCSLIFKMAETYSARVSRWEQIATTLRRDMQRLTKNLNENQEYIQQSEYTIKLEERNRVSQEIHDQVGHTMAGALIQMEASKRLMATNQEQAAQLLQNAIQLSKEGLEQIRLTLKNMKPPLEQLGISRLQLFINEFAARNQVQATLVHIGDLEQIMPIHWKIIQENVTEALTNAMKYGEPRTISVEIHVLNKFIKAVVHNDGKSEAKIKKGLGILGMEERTATVGGTLIVDGTNGFSVTTLIPIA